MGGSKAEIDAATAKAAEALWAAKGSCVVLAGSNNEGVQVLVNSINNMLGNYGSTIDLAGHTYFKQGDDAAVAQLVKDMNAGAIGALLIAGVNPAYSLPNAAEFKAGLGKVGLTVSFSGYADETASLCMDLSRTTTTWRAGTTSCRRSVTTRWRSLPSAICSARASGRRACSAGRFPHAPTTTASSAHGQANWPAMVHGPIRRQRGTRPCTMACTRPTPPHLCR